VGCSGLLVNVGPMPAITWATPIATAVAKAPLGVQTVDRLVEHVEGIILAGDPGVPCNRKRVEEFHVSVSQLEAGIRLARWRRLCLSSFLLAGITALILWAALADLRSQGGLGTVLLAGRAELAAPLLAPLLVAEQLIEPFRAQALFARYIQPLIGQSRVGSEQV